MYQKILCSTHCSRPEYSKQFIDKLRECEDIQNWKLILCAEPLNEEVISLLRGIDFCEKDVIINPKILGVALNARQAMTRGFEESDFIVYVESDCLISRDSLVQLWRVGNDYADCSSPTISLFNRRFHNNGADSYKESDFANLEEVDRFVTYGYGAWKDKFSPVFQVMCDSSCLSCEEAPNMNYGMFNARDFTGINLSEKLYHQIIGGKTHPSHDIIINNFFAWQKKNHLTFSLGRVINNGVVGIHLTGNESAWWQENVQCDVWADNIKELTCTT